MMAVETIGAGVEAKIQNDIIKKLTLRDWICMPTHGNMFQRGFPDVYAVHLKHGQRWIEVKNPRRFSFTAAQKKYFPIMSACGIGIWVLTSDSDLEFEKLFQPPNMILYMNGLVPVEVDTRSTGMQITALERTLTRGQR